MEDEVLANAGVDVFEEVFKLIFTKLYDELACFRGKRGQKYLRFRNQNTAAQLRTAIQALFDEAKNEWEGVFPQDEKIKLAPDHLQVCVGSLEEWKLFNSNLDVVDDAFEYLVNQSAKGEKGQYFTPRWVIDMCVKMLNPHEDENLIDTACGSAGFTVHSIFHVWKSILQDEGMPISHLFTMEKKPERCYDYVQDKVFAIDFDEKSVRVARCLNLIAGDGQTNVLHLNTLDFTKWDETTKQQDWLDTYHEGWKKLRRLMAMKIGARRGLPAGALQLRQQTRRFARHDDERCLPFLIGLDCLPTIETSICPGEDLYDARRESAKNTLQMARNLLARWPIAVVQLAPDVFSGFRQKGKDRLITLLAFVLRVVAFPAAHLSAIERVHGRIGVQRDGAQPHVGRLPHPFSHPLLHLQQLPRHSQM